MRVRELWRYPVKSMQGEQLEQSTLTRDGFVGDRQSALFDVATGKVLTGRRDPQLLFAAARLTEDGSLRIVLPDGRAADDDAALSAWLGRPVEVRHAHSPAGGPLAFPDSTVPFHDDDLVRVSLISTSTIGSWAPRRFRSNVLLDGSGEDSLVGSDVHLGAAVVRVGMRIDRCVMTTRPQPGGIDRDPEVLRTIHREHGGALAVGATVVRPGLVRIGDVLGA